MQDNNLIDVNLTSEMKTSFIDYAMSVIVSRALPDVRDGLKPVHQAKHAQQSPTWRSQGKKILVLLQY